MSLLDEVKQAKAAHKTMILARPNVVGLGVGYKESHGRLTDELSVVVLVRRKLPPASLSAEALVPREVGGVRTDVIEAGDLRPLQARTDRWRPARGGVSVGHYKITAGTLGCLVYDRRSGAPLILSNNHVLANSNDAEQDDPILQPGPADGGQLERDVIARLERFRPLPFNLEEATCTLAEGYARLGNALARLAGSRHQLKVFKASPFAAGLVDAAVARPISEEIVQDDVLEIGRVTGVVLAELGMAVRKSGRTTAFTTGVISILDATTVVNYGPARSATFEHQIVTATMSRGGDSGSLLVEADSPRAVGLLFAGSDQITIYNPIQAVLDALDIVMTWPAQDIRNARRAAVEKAQAVREACQDMLMAKANVVGVGVGLRHSRGRRTEEVGLVVMVRRKLPKALLDAEDLLPQEIEGVPVDVREVGKIEAY